MEHDCKDDEFLLEHLPVVGGELAGTQVRLIKVEGKKQKVRAEVEMAMTQDLVTAVQLVAERAANAGA